MMRRAAVVKRLGRSGWQRRRKLVALYPNWIRFDRLSRLDVMGHFTNVNANWG